MSSSFVDQLDAFLGTKKKKRNEAPNFIFVPRRITVLRSWLTDNERKPDDYYDHYFNPPVGIVDRQNQNAGFIIHNHDDFAPCATPHFCFEWGYKPPTGELEAFWLVNGKYYGVNKTSTPTVPKINQEPTPLGNRIDALASIFSF